MDLIGWDCVEVILNSGIRSIRMKKCPRAALICIQRTAAPRLVGSLHKKAQGAELERPSGRWVLPLRWGMGGCGRQKTECSSQNALSNYALS